ncbi:hypothetical protein MASR1M12_37850 [Erysipelotrichia bacterium]
MQTLEGQTCELQLNVLSSAIGPDLASGGLYQEIAIPVLGPGPGNRYLFSIRGRNRLQQSAFSKLWPTRQPLPTEKSASIS